MRQRLEERPLLGLRRQREQLLELVDDQQQLAVLGYHAAGGRGRCRRTPASCCGEADRCRRPRLARRLTASSLYGAPPGSIVATNQASEPLAPPARSRGSRPGPDGAGLAGARRRRRAAPAGSAGPHRTGARARPRRAPRVRSSCPRRPRRTRAGPGTGCFPGRPQARGRRARSAAVRSAPRPCSALGRQRAVRPGPGETSRPASAWPTSAANARTSSSGAGASGPPSQKSVRTGSPEASYSTLSTVSRPCARPSAAASPRTPPSRSTRVMTSRSSERRAKQPVAQRAAGQRAASPRRRRRARATSRGSARRPGGAATRSGCAVASNARMNAGSSARSGRTAFTTSSRSTPGQVGGAHGAVPPGAEPLAEPVAAQRLAAGHRTEQPGVLGEDPPLELDERRRRVDTELLDELVAEAAEDREGVAPAGRRGSRRSSAGHGTPPGAGAHGRAASMVGRTCGGVAARELSLDEELLGSEAELGQLLRLREGPRLVGELGVRLPVPERQRSAQSLDRVDGVLPAQRGAGSGDVGLEVGDVEGEAVSDSW